MRLRAVETKIINMEIQDKESTQTLDSMIYFVLVKPSIEVQSRHAEYPKRQIVLRWQSVHLLS
jgi:hypothetical protein